MKRQAGSKGLAGALSGSSRCRGVSGSCPSVAGAPGWCFQGPRREVETPREAR